MHVVLVVAVIDFVIIANCVDFAGNGRDKNYYICYNKVGPCRRTESRVAEGETMEEFIAREVLERKKETLKSKMEFWEIVHHARKSELVKDKFVDRLMREGLSANTNGELVTQFLKEITVQSGWFDRFTSILEGISKYRHLAMQLNDGEFGRNIILY